MAMISVLHCPAVRGKYKGFVLYGQKRQYNENINCMGETAVVLPQCGDFGRVKPKSPIFPGAGDRGYK